MRQHRMLVWMFAGVLVPAVANGQTGVFRSAYTSGANAAATGIAVGDFDQDGAQDVALCSTSQTGESPGDITVLYGFCAQQAAMCGDGTLTEASPQISLASVPSAMVQGKFDGDALDDLVVAGNDGTISFLKGLGTTGYFAMPTSNDTSAGENPVGLAAADLDGDGKLDVIVADQGPGSGAPGGVTILQGDGMGDFTLVEQTNPTPGPTPIVDSLPAGVGTTAVAVGNIDADPGLEILALNSSPNPGSSGTTGTISIFTSDGCGRPAPNCLNFRPYTPQATLPTGNMPEDLALADLNGDGKLDLIVANSNDDAVTVQLGNGDGTFGTAQSFPVGTAPMRLKVGDINRDGHLDIVTSNSFSVDVSVLFGDGTGNFSRARSFVATPQPQQLALDDFNADGKLDVVVAPVDAEDPVADLLYRPDGALQGVEDISAGSGPQSLAAADLDGDGRPDLLASVNGSEVAIFPSTPNGFAEPIRMTIGGRTLGVAAADLNGDVRPDIVVADEQNSRVAVLFSQGGGRFAPPVFYPTAPSPVAVAVGDFNADGRPDLAVIAEGNDRVCVAGSAPMNTSCTSDSDCGAGGLCAAPGKVSTLLQQADGSFGTAQTTDLNPEEEPIAIAVANINCDGKDDLLVANLASNSVSVLTSNGDGTFTSLKTIDQINLPIALAVADFNQDGVQDFAVVNSFLASGPDVQLYAGSCTGTPFTQTLPGYSRSVTQLARAVVARDFTGDGTVDLGLLDSTDNALFLLAGNPTSPGALNLLNADSVSRMPIAVAAADFDLDGRYDAATANDSVANNISVLYNCARDVAGVNGAAVSCNPFATQSNPGPKGSAALRGDGNGDGIRSAADLVAVALEVMDGDGFAVEDIGRGSYHASPGVDANGDGRVDAQDRIAVAHRIFGG